MSASSVVGAAEAEGLHFRDLGPLEVLRDGVPVLVRGTRLAAALSLFLVHAGRHVEAAALEEAMWGGQSRSRAPSTVESHVWRLRKCLEPDRGRGAPSEVLRREAGGYRLVTAPDAVDSLQCGRLATRARDALTGGDPVEARRCAEQALGLWRGRPYPTVADEAWAVPAVARLTEMRDQLRGLLVESLLATGAPDRALLELEPAIVESPLRERLYALHMRVQHRLGRTEEALRTYQQARALLRDELGLEPGAELRETHALILTEDPALAAEVPAAVPPAEHAWHLAPDADEHPAEEPRSTRLLAVAALCGPEFDIAVVRSAVTVAPALCTPDEVFAALAQWTAEQPGRTGGEEHDPLPVPGRRAGREPRAHPRARRAGRCPPPVG